MFLIIFENLETLLIHRWLFFVFNGPGETGNFRWQWEPWGKPSCGCCLVHSGEAWEISCVMKFKIPLQHLPCVCIPGSHFPGRPLRLGVYVNFFLPFFFFFACKGKSLHNNSLQSWSPREDFDYVIGVNPQPTAKPASFFFSELALEYDSWWETDRMAGPFAFSFLSLAFVCFSVHVCTHAHTSGYTCATAHKWKHRTMWRSWVSPLQHRDQGSNSDYRAWWQRLCLRGHLVTLSSFSLIFFSLLWFL